MSADLSWASNLWVWAITFERVTDNRPNKKHRPILFRGPMVRAILDGRKTQTRRVIAPEHAPTAVLKYDTPGVQVILEGGSVLTHWLEFRPETSALIEFRRPGMRSWTPTPARLRRELRRHPKGHRWSYTEAAGLCPYGVPGDRLWVRETWMPAMDAGGGLVRYAADYDDAGREHMASLQRWRPSIHMPRQASRLTLEVVSVRVQRLQEISEEDARAEGVLADYERAVAAGATVTDDIPNARRLFARVWDSINGQREGAPGRAA